MLAAGLELHARIINSYLDKDESGLPPGFKFFESLPPAPPGCAWRWSVATQQWAAFNGSSGAKCRDLGDGFKYALGIKWVVMQRGTPREGGFEDNQGPGSCAEVCLPPAGVARAWRAALGDRSFSSVHTRQASAHPSAVVGRHSHTNLQVPAQRV